MKLAILAVAALAAAPLAADPAGKAVLDKDIPGMTADPRSERFESMTLGALQPMSEGQITDAQLAAAKRDLPAIK